MTWLIYFSGIVDNLRFFLIIFFIVIGVYLLFISFLYLDIIENRSFVEEEVKERAKIWFNNLKKNIILIFILPTLACFIPNSETIAAMYILPKIVNNEKIKKIPEDLLDIVNKKLKEWGEEK